MDGMDGYALAVGAARGMANAIAVDGTCTLEEVLAERLDSWRGDVGGSVGEMKVCASGHTYVVTVVEVAGAG